MKICCLQPSWKSSALYSMTVKLYCLDLLLLGAKTKRAHRYVCYHHQQGLKLSDKLDGGTVNANQETVKVRETNRWFRLDKKIKEKPICKLLS